MDPEDGGNNLSVKCRPISGVQFKVLQKAEEGKGLLDLSVVSAKADT